MRQSSLPMAVAFLIAGCTAGPNYRLPEGALANAADSRRAFISADNDNFSAASLPDHWWRLYEDQSLDGLVREALAANTDLRAADANLQRADAAIREAKAAQTVGSTIDSQVTDTKRGGIDAYSIPRWSYLLAFGVSYPLDLAGGLRRSVEAARANAQVAEALRDQTRVTVAAAVANNYVTVCSANRSLAAARQVLDIETDTLEEIQRLFQGGRSTAFDVTRAATAVHQSAATLPPFIAQRQAALFALAALLGRPVAAYPRELEACAAPPGLRLPLPVGDGAALIRRRSDIRAAERSLAAATASIGVETSHLYPEVDLGGAVGYAAPFPLSTLRSPQSLGAHIGPILSWTFPNVSATRARIAEAGAAAQAAEANFDGAVLGALQQTESALEVYTREVARHAQLKGARDSAAKATDQARTLLRFGRITILDVLTAEASLAAAEAALAASDAAIANDQVSVFLALGGGWDADARG